MCGPFKIASRSTSSSGSSSIVSVASSSGTHCPVLRKSFNQHCSLTILKGNGQLITAPDVGRVKTLASSTAHTSVILRTLTVPRINPGSAGVVRVLRSGGCAELGDLYEKSDELIIRKRE